MTATPTIQSENLIFDESITSQDRWMTVIFNNDHTPIDRVIRTIMKSTGCDLSEAEMETWEAQAFGKAPIHFASESECNEVAAAMRNIGVKSEVTTEWVKV